MLNWASRFSICAFLDNNAYASAYHSVECIVAAGSISSIRYHPHDSFSALEPFVAQAGDWIFGHISYDTKNQIEKLRSRHDDHIGFDDMHFFVPQYLLELNADTLTIGSHHEDHVQVYSAIMSVEYDSSTSVQRPVISARLTKEKYVEIIESIKAHIHRGDCYELNYCQEFFATEADVSPHVVFERLTQNSPSPFSTFYRINNSYLLSASPERFLKRVDQKLVSQPMKGTIRRDVANDQREDAERQQLMNDPKERSENVMIVDLVRNDLSKVCVEGSVVVEELFGIYSFPSVHQMISTVAGTIRESSTITDIIRATFPMASMTGAPKKRVMELIDQYETFRRGLFSGAVGYIAPNGDFDFNVVIRSILYNAASGYLSFPTGSAITFYSDADKEYEECLLKAEAIKKVLTL
jgi:para-aminobenzoate synthetase component I